MQKKAESKVLVFPGDPSDPKKPQQQLVLTGLTLGKGQYGLVQYAHARDNAQDVYAVKVIERKRVHGSKAMQNL